MTITGTGSDDTLSGTADSDIFDLTQGGSDSARGKAGNDAFLLGAALDATDAIRAGDGYDIIQLNGAYNLVLGANTLSRVEEIDLADGHDYAFTMNDGNVLAGQQLRILGQSLSANSLTFDGSAETSGSFQVDGGLGDDVLTGGAGNDTMSGHIGHNTLHGGAGNDVLESRDINSVDLIDGGSGTDYASLDREDRTADLTFEFKGPNNTTKLIGDGGTKVTGVEAFSLRGGSGDDRFTGGAGDDDLNGSFGSNILNGGAGDDRLRADTGGHNTFIGGTGDDDITQNDTTDTIDGGDGFDSAALNHRGTSANLTFHFTDASAVTTLVGDGTTVTGIEQFSIQSGSGNDVLSAAAGDDFLDGGVGDDTIRGGAGNDTLYGEDGTNRMSGGAGDDFINSQGGVADIINGGSGHDRASLQQSSATVDLALVITDPTAYATLIGEGTQIKNIESFNIDGGSGNDTFTMFGKGDDELEGREGNNHLSGAGGDDFLRAGVGDDVFNGGDGRDEVSFNDSSNAVTVDLVAGTATGQGSDTLISVEDVTGGDGDDTLTGNDTDNVLSDGGGGADTLSGGGGNDELQSNSAGADTIDGGSGNDLADIYRGNMNTDLTFALRAPGQVSTLAADGTTVTGVERIDITGGDGNDSFTGGDGDDTLDGNGGTNTLNGGSGNDTIYHRANTGTDTIDGGDGIDTAILRAQSDTDTVFVMTSVAGVTKMTGGHGATVTNVENINFSGSNGQDVVATLDGKDIVGGGDGNDMISTGGGHDEITGGGGADILDGGLGNDVFQYYDVTESTGALYDTIRGFDGARDKLGFTGPEIVGVDKAIGSGALSTATFDNDLQAGVTAKGLHAASAVLFTASSGSLSGETFLIVDANGKAGYQAGADYVIHLDGATHLGDLSTAGFQHLEILS